MRDVSLCLIHSIYNNRQKFVGIFLCSEAVVVVMVSLGAKHNKTINPCQIK